MARRYRIVSADSHVNPPPTFWREYLPASCRAAAPQLERTPTGDFVVFEGRRTPFGVLGAMAGRKFEEYRTTGKVDEARPGGWQPAARVEDQDLDGVDAEVLYGGGPLGSRDVALHLASFRAYNDWLADFTSNAPDRLIGMAYIPMLDVERAIGDLRHAAQRGLRGAVIAAFPPSREGTMTAGGLGLSGDPTRSYSTPEFEPFWRAAIELNMPIHMHLGARRSESDPERFMTGILMTKFAMAEPIALFIHSGLLARYPELKLVSVESGVGWMAFALEYMDHIYQRHRYWTKSPLKEPPSFYFRRQVLGTFLNDPAGVRERHAIGVNNIMWSSDYPHSETTWPNSRTSIQEHFHGVPEDERSRITCRNAVELYRLGGS